MSRALGIGGGWMSRSEGQLACSLPPLPAPLFSSVTLGLVHLFRPRMLLTSGYLCPGSVHVRQGLEPSQGETP